MITMLKMTLETGKNMENFLNFINLNQSRDQSMIIITEYAIVKHHVISYNLL